MDDICVWNIWIGADCGCRGHKTPMDDICVWNIWIGTDDAAVNNCVIATG